MGVTGAWVRRSQQPALSTIQAPIDDQHMTPDPNPDGSGQPESWVSTVSAPDLPDFLMVPVDYPPPVFAPGGPVDNTPQDHQHGPGAGWGYSQDEGSIIRSEWQSEDLGTVAAENWLPTPAGVDQYQRAEVDDMVGNGDSPETLEYRRTGVGRPNDPDARRAHRQKRWTERYIDDHRWQAHPTPVVPRYSRGVPAREAIPDGTQIDSPFGNSVHQYSGPFDRFLQPQVRRAPERNGDAWASDGTHQNVMGTVDQYGLTVWGA